MGQPVYKVASLQNENNNDRKTRIFNLFYEKLISSIFFSVVVIVVVSRPKLKYRICNSVVEKKIYVVHFLEKKSWNE